MDQDLKFIAQVLRTEIQGIEASLLRAYPDRSLKDKITTGTVHKDDGKVVAYLSFTPDSPVAKASIDLTFSIYCRDYDMIFASEEFVPLSSRVGTTRGESDHLPVLAEFGWR